MDKSRAHDRQTGVTSPLAPLSFLVAGVARNCASRIQDDVLRLAEALAPARQVRWLVVESDSDDDTPGQLEALAGRLAGFEHLSLGRTRETLPRRTERLAHCRNAYVARLRHDPQYADVDYVIVADLDGVNTLVTSRAIESCFVRADWSACFANQSGPYYDLWALRHPVWNPGDCWAQYHFLERFEPNTERNLDASVYARMIRVPEDADWIEVDSAFGGLAVYRKAAFDYAGYAGTDASGAECCEHVNLHAAMRRAGARLFINPQLINAGHTEHSLALRPWPALGREARALAKSLAIKLLGTPRALRIRRERSRRRGE